MICTNELAALKCNKRAILEPLVVAIAPYAPHIAEELWEMLGNNNTIAFETWPEYDESKLVESTKTIAIQVNGKVRGEITISVDENEDQIKEKAL